MPRAGTSRGGCRNGNQPTSHIVVAMSVLDSYPVLR